MEADLRVRDAKIREDLDTISRLNASLEERVRARTRELEQAQARLVDAERFTAMGKTAAAIAHEVRNALNGLGMCVDLVLADHPPQAGAASARVHAQIHHEIARLRDITESLLTFARTPRLERAPVDVRALCARALDTLGEQIADGAVAVEADPPDAPPVAIVGDGYKLQGVLVNLVKNAVEAMTTRPLDLGEGAAPDVAAASTAAAGGPQRRLIVHARTEGDAVVVELGDTGPGLLPEARAHLFEPFFTTKVTGTGLGLATARRIVEAHGGTIEIVPAAAGGEGTLVRLRLPRGEPDTAAAAAAAG
jgi:signal transduction histidine kinase